MDADRSIPTGCRAREQPSSVEFIGAGDEATAAGEKNRDVSSEENKAKL